VLRYLLSRAADGEAKFHVTWAALQLRREHERTLRDGEYLPLQVQGERAAHVLAFARHDGVRWVIVVATRLPASLGLQVGEAPIGPVWGDTRVMLPAPDAPSALPGGAVLEDVLNGRVHAVDEAGLALAQLLCDFPMALLKGRAGAAG
jgi:(1->4)-alpha-D-glucan 1-alpha-D-glucosylmutase